MAAPILGSNVATSPTLPKQEVNSRKVSFLIEQLNSQATRRAKILRLVGNHVPHSTAKSLTKIMVETGLVQPKDFDPGMISILPTGKIECLTLNQLVQLEIEHIGKLSTEQLLGFSPHQLVKIGKNAVFLLHSLGPHREKHFARWMQEWVRLRDSDPEFVRTLFKDCGKETTDEFLILLERSRFAEAIVPFYQLLKKPLSMRVMTPEIEEFFVQLSQRMNKRKDVGGQQIIQIRNHSGDVFELFQSFKKSVTHHLVSNYLMDHLCLPRHGKYELDISHGVPICEFRVYGGQLELALHARCILRSQRTHYILGYTDVEFYAMSSLNRLIKGDLSRIATSAHISAVYQRRVNFEYGPHPERQDGKMKKSRVDLLKRLATKEKELETNYEDNLAIDLILLQFKKELAVINEASKLIEVISRGDVTLEKLRSALGHRPLALELINRLEEFVLEKKQILDEGVVNSAVCAIKAKGTFFAVPGPKSYYGFNHSYRHQTSSPFAWAQDQQLVKELILQSLDAHRKNLNEIDQLKKICQADLQSLELFEKNKENIIKLIIEKIIGDIKRLESKKNFFITNAKENVLQNVFAALKEKKRRAKQSAGALRRLVNTNQEEIHLFKSDLKIAIHQAFVKKRVGDDAEEIGSEVRRKDKRKTIDQIPEDTMLQLKEKYTKESSLDERTVSLHDLFSEVLYNLKLNLLMKKIADNSQGELDEYLDLLIKEAMVTFFGAQLNFPARAKKLAMAIVERLPINLTEKSS